MKTKMIIKDQKGGALIEFAIVAPLLILLVIGAIEFGLLCYNKQVIANASREGSRAGIIAFGRDYYLDNDQIITIVKNYCATHVITFSASPDLDTDLNVTLDPTNREDTTSFEFGDHFEVKVKVKVPLKLTVQKTAEELVVDEVVTVKPVSVITPVSLFFLATVTPAILPCDVTMSPIKPAFKTCTELSPIAASIFKLPKPPLG